MSSSSPSIGIKIDVKAILVMFLSQLFKHQLNHFAKIDFDLIIKILVKKVIIRTYSLIFMEK